MQDIYRTAYLLTLLLVAISNGFDVVVARSQQSVKVAPLCSKDPHSTIQHNDRPNNRLSTLVPRNATHPFMDLGGEHMESKLRLYNDEGNNNHKSSILFYRFILVCLNTCLKLEH